MKIWLSLSVSGLFLFSNWLSAESELVDIPAGELLDAYLEDESTNTRKPLVRPEPETAKNDPVLEEDQAVEFRKVRDSEGVQVYEVMPAEPANREITATNKVDEKSSGNFEIIELESHNEEVVEVEAPGSKDIEVAAYTSKHDHIYCQQNPFAKECLYAPYLSRCEKDPESLKCRSQLEQFEKFCDTFPRAYKCKKAQLAATCKQQPSLNECKSFTERYCLRYPKAIFCNWN